MCPKIRPVARWRKEKKDRNFYASNWPGHPRRHRPLKFCIRGHVREVVKNFKFHENRLRGFGAVCGWKSPSPIDLAHGLYNSLYYRTSRDCWRTCFLLLAVHCAVTILWVQTNWLEAVVIAKMKLLSIWNIVTIWRYKSYRKSRPLYQRVSLRMSAKNRANTMFRIHYLQDGLKK